MKNRIVVIKQLMHMLLLERKSIHVDLYVNRQELSRKTMVAHISLTCVQPYGA